MFADRTSLVSFMIAAVVGVLTLSSLQHAFPATQPNATKPASQPASANRSTSKPLLFETHIQPLLKANCVRCHNPKARKAELDLTSFAGLLKGGESGPIVAGGKPKDSLLYEMLHDGLMPPEKKNRLSKSDIELIRRWIATGAVSKTGRSAESVAVTQHNIQPLLYLRCTACHGLRRKEAGLDLRTKASILKGGKSGPAMLLGKPAESLILKRIRNGKMPPRRKLVSVSVKPMQPLEVEMLAKWIQLGAPESAREPDVATTEPDSLVTNQDREFWSFQRPRSPEIPTVKHADRVRNPIDAFILWRLEQRGLSLSTATDRVTLVRRAYFDLTGLPPSPKQLDEFLNDQELKAYERLIDRLLASRQYGEHWARHWLDVAGYADSEGAQNEDRVRPNMYRYRDYVIRAFNSDKPYDRFLHEQLAGDELADANHAEVIDDKIYDNLVATGFLRTAPDRTFANITNFVPDRLEVIADEMQILSSAVMGLTINCARCHSHKFDPIPQRDYYRLLAVFKDAYDEHDWLMPQTQRTLTQLSTTERNQRQAHEKQISGQIDALKKDLDARAEPARQTQLEKRIAELPAVLRGDVKQALATNKPQRSAVQNYLLKKFEKRLTISREELKKLDANFKKTADQTDAQIKKLGEQRKPDPKIRALWSRGEPSPTYLLKRGNYLTPGRPVGPGVPSVLTDGKTPLQITPPWPGAKKTGRRLAFARWLTNPQHPLTARVMVNRIWKHHFATGIVKTLGNFGKAGDRPSHPGLLDWLAVEFVKREWSIKAMHRLMMTSSMYRQSSRVTATAARVDPENRLLARMPLQRMQAEVLRDSLLFIAGRLDPKPFGPADQVTRRGDGLVTANSTKSGWRRSIYVLQRRTQLPTLLENFDSPQMNPNCIERGQSIVAPQALHLLNNGMVHQLAGHFAERVQREAGSDVRMQIKRAHLIAFSRQPTAEQLDVALQAITTFRRQWQKESTNESLAADVIAQRALANYCHAIINSAAFLYID